MLFRLALLLLLYFILRCLFLLFNIDAFKDMSLGTITAAFFTGLRADLVATGVTNSIVLLLSLLFAQTETSSPRRRVDETTRRFIRAFVTASYAILLTPARSELSQN
jgi:RsiW-degrading membrane proteinase PrsW (M82 family)